MTRYNNSSENPYKFTCPICHEIMVTPVAVKVTSDAADGKRQDHVEWYDEFCLRRSFNNGKQISPLSRLDIYDSSFSPLHRETLDELEARYNPEDWNRKKEQNDALGELSIAPIHQQFPEELARLQEIANREKITFDLKALVRENKDKVLLLLENTSSIETLCAANLTSISELWGLDKKILISIFYDLGKTKKLIVNLDVSLKKLGTFSNYRKLIHFVDDFVRLKFKKNITIEDISALSPRIRTLIFTRINLVARLICDFNVKWGSFVTIKESEKYDIILTSPRYFKNIIDTMEGACWDVFFQTDIELLRELEQNNILIAHLSKYCSLTWKYYASLAISDREFLYKNYARINGLVRENGLTLKSLIELPQQDRDWLINNDYKIKVMIRHKIITAEKLLKLTIGNRSKLFEEHHIYQHLTDKMDVESYLNLSQPERQIIRDIVYKGRLNAENAEFIFSKINNYIKISDFIDLQSLIQLPFEVQKILLNNTENLCAAYQKGIPLLNYLKTFQSDVLARLINYVVNHEQDMLDLQSVGISLNDLAYLNESSWAYFQANNLKIIDFIREKKANNFTESDVISLKEIIDTLRAREPHQWTHRFIQIPQQKAPECSSAETRIRIVKLPPPPLFSSNQKKVLAGATVSSLIGGGLWIALATGTLKMHALGNSSLALHFMSAALPVAIGITAVSVGTLIGVGLYAGVKRHHENLEPRIQFQRVT